MVSFEIKENKKVEGFIHFDFTGDNYDNPDAEFNLNPGDVGEEYIKVKRIINSGEVPSKDNIYFRLFTNSGGEFSIKNLEIHEVVRYYDYETVYANDTTIVLENKNFIPRFYFIEEVIDVNNLVEAKNILWEEAVFWEYDKFDVKTTALVQDVDF